MSKHLVAIAFLKESKIDYRLEKDKIVFPCFNCYSEVEMEQSTTNWNCAFCNNAGTLRHLIEAIEHQKNLQLEDKMVYHPNKVFKEIEKDFDRIIKKNINKDIIEKMIVLKENTIELIQYLLDKNRGA
ncbi:hypothetical protein [Bacillus sp. ISL-39]|uniref:hypothetical protein n=1 Tax=Bacillus sp. ISL-39 TaxID=2819124 RepID=UPI001BEC941B|nr:hypothetical protein [Bacillus sp. ISL-39]MBT2636435.1 hypothetical protein [Bacillus sp. ISL-39]